jgi:hypothetical protein
MCRAIVVVEPISEIDKPVCDAEPISCKAPTIEVDTRSHFVMDKTFVNREDLLKWAHGVAAKLRFAIVILRSGNGGDRRKLFLVLGCKRVVSTNLRTRS